MKDVQRILIVDDEASMREMLGIMLRREGYDVVLADSRVGAASVLAQGPVDMVITDVKLPDGDGIEILRHVKAASVETAVIVMTAYGSTQTAVAALKLGAHDYLVKPFDVDELRIVVRNALDRRRLEEENLLLKAELQTRHGLERIIGASAAMQKIFGLIRSVAGTSSTVLISGESGTGKELVAKAIHALSARKDAPFVSVNCAALPETLLESELFGHMKGAFTDAHQTRKGLFEAAHKGTLLLDEIGDVPLTMQAKLLRVLQEKRVRRLGASEEVEVDVRVIAASNRSLDSLVQEKRFREDLFYRLNVIPVHVPPLRERPEDIPLLAEHFLRRFCGEMGKSVNRLSEDVIHRFLRYPWPGNVRELENVMERAVALEVGSVIRPERLPDSLRARTAAVAEGEPLPEGFDLDAYIRTVEADLVRRALQQAQGDRPGACRLLGVSSRSLRYLLSKHQIADSG